MGNRIDDLEKSIGDLMQQVCTYVFILSLMIFFNAFLIRYLSHSSQGVSVMHYFICNGSVKHRESIVDQIHV